MNTTLVLVGINALCWLLSASRRNTGVLSTSEPGRCGRYRKEPAQGLIQWRDRGRGGSEQTNGRKAHSQYLLEAAFHKSGADHPMDHENGLIDAVPSIAEVRITSILRAAVLADRCFLCFSPEHKITCMNK